MNLFTVLILLLLAGLIVLALRHCIRKKKRGCGGSCGGCPYAGSCHDKENS